MNSVCDCYKNKKLIRLVCSFDTYIRMNKKGIQCRFQYDDNINDCSECCCEGGSVRRERFLKDGKVKK